MMRRIVNEDVSEMLVLLVMTYHMCVSGHANNSVDGGGDLLLGAFLSLSSSFH